ncbi:TetR/AcrR family transcriptional regulator [Pseudonocardia kunmingensis]|uniref:TetR family transcriptional regulator n=1 Tax=Pseudonocardia kunmingensis TaxID=630975 RepID=A0A543C244_9PSEU|nr:TetR/AcrR family transcriptional regulator [Pseudonocardia kunmingensis]TQL91137.1 TetR family transcriptional regulator [Pseudonocardia kunmingensis]
MEERDRENLSSRDKVLLAAMELFGEEPGTRLSVRAVASRAGVSTGSLRYHFPTQRELQDEVLTRIYDLVVPDDRIHDTSAPARDRLVDCLRQVLAGSGVGAQARANLRKVVEEFIAPEPTDDGRAAYLAIEREGRRRVEYWLTVLTNEGALAEGDNTRRARFLLTVVNGLGLERALPAEDSILQSETDTLYAAVDCVLSS